jgi:hypothetical protein
MITPPNSTQQGLIGLISYTNDATGGLMMPLFLLVIYVVIIISQLEYQFPRAFLTASLVTSVLAIMLAIGGLLAPSYAYFGLVMTGLGVLWVRLTYN